MGGSWPYIHPHKHGGTCDRSDGLMLRAGRKGGVSAIHDVTTKVKRVSARVPEMMSDSNQRPLLLGSMVAAALDYIPPTPSPICINLQCLLWSDPSTYPVTTPA